MNAELAELRAMRTELTAMRERLDAIARMAGIFYDAGGEDARMTGSDRPADQLATVVPLLRKGGRS